MTDILKGANVVLGVTGSIACYKAVGLASKLTQAGALVNVMMTEGATKFVTPLSFKAITHRPVHTDLFDPQGDLNIDHVSAALDAKVCVVAPATANTIAAMALGLSNNVLTSTILATTAPVIVVPAMDGNMYENPAVQEHLDKLKSRGFIIIGPLEGRLASGITGLGRFAEVSDVVGVLKKVIANNGDFTGRKIVVTAGGTQEAVDVVRVITNRSSGKMGYAIAEAARDRGSDVVLITGPTSLPPIPCVDVINVVTALDMQEEVERYCIGADVLIMAAAVADWRPVSPADNKIKKGASDSWSIDLTKNPDIIAGLKANKVVKVGFAAESEAMLENACAKLKSKGLDLIVANDVGEGDVFGSDNNKVTLIERSGEMHELAPMPKYEIGHHILDRVSSLII